MFNSTMTSFKPKPNHDHIIAALRHELENCRETLENMKDKYESLKNNIATVFREFEPFVKAMNDLNAFVSQEQ